MPSMGRALAAVLAAPSLCCGVSLKPQRWAFLVAALYVVDVPVRHRWDLPQRGAACG
jgi:uncharacterized RDD family membrane protein YckC